MLLKKQHDSAFIVDLRNPSQSKFQVLRQWVRQCFHGGSVGGASAGLGPGATTGARPVNGRQMMLAMFEYVWPKDNPEVRLAT